MKFSGTVEIAAPRDAVWTFVSDPTKVGSCGPGVESITPVDATHYAAVAKVGVGFISARFNAAIEMAELIAPTTARIRVHGQAPGSAADAVASMDLSGDPAGPTTMQWEAEVTISGTLASVGARMIEGTANKLIGQTFDCIRAKLEA
jgi:carbon monoxide dehydrogenase subunit G